jgi:hypothetical protein
MAADVAAYVLTTLRATSAVTDLVMEADAGIFESGDCGSDALAAAETTRRDDGNPAKVLALVVQDAGEKTLDARRSEQRANVWFFDRQRGYANIRAVRQQVYQALQGKSTALTSPYDDRSVVITIEMESRTGHRHEHALEVDYELMAFKAVVHLDLG